jgi:predicted Zn-dependent peptidase
MKLAYLLLTEPVVENSSLSRWKGGLRQGLEGRRMQVRGLLDETVENAFFAPAEVRKHPIQTAQARKITAASAQAWLRSVVSSHPIEVAVVGDIDRDTAKRLVATYVGSLPGRPRIGPTTFAGKRVIPRPTCPISVDRSVDVQTPQAFVLDGFFGPDPKELTDSRLLRVAARVLTTRMTTTIREKMQLVYSISAGMRSDAVYPGFSTFAAQAPTDPAKGAALAAALEDMYAAFAKDGPTEDEMTVARKQFALQFDEEVKTPKYWLDLLTVPDYRGTDLGRALVARAAYEKFTAAEVKGAFAKYFRPDARFHFVVKPSAGGEKPAAAPAPMPPDGGDDK